MIDPEKERESFISVRDLVAAIAVATRKDEPLAAGMLVATLAKDEVWQALPIFEFSKVYGLVEVTDPNSRRENQLRQRLARWANTGNDKPSFEDSDDIPF